MVLFDPFLEQQELMADHLGPFKEHIIKAKEAEEFEQRIFMWCINYYVPLRQFKPGEIHIAFYENFAEKPREECERLFTFLNEPWDDRVFEAIRRPSEVTKPDAAIMTGKSVVAGWMDEVGPERTKRALEVLQLFGLDKIYGDSPMPSLEGAYACMAPR